jgi:pyocin large subunit-like protein
MSLAFAVPVDTAAERIVLVTYAWRAGGKLIAWPGLDQLEADTRLYRETITAARRALVDHGYLIDTGKRQGKRGRTVVYRLNLRQLPHSSPPQSAAYAADIEDPICGFSDTNARQMPHRTVRQMPQKNLISEQSIEQFSAQAREQVQAQSAATPEQVQGRGPDDHHLEDEPLSKPRDRALRLATHLRGRGIKVKGTDALIIEWVGLNATPRDLDRALELSGDPKISVVTLNAFVSIALAERRLAR